MLRSHKASRLIRALPSSRRAAHDLTVLPSKPVISYGPAGRSAVSGHVATVFGATGFLGRYLVAKLAKGGTQVIVPYREEDEARHLRVTGDLGQVVPLEWDIRNEQQIRECVRHSDIVYNLVGREYETKNFDYQSVHVTGAELIAQICAESPSVSRLVHVSHLNAAVDSPSAFYRTKALGEQKVKKAFPNATIVRPGPMFGHEDKLLNSMAIWPILWKLNYGETQIAPVHVFDVAQALAQLQASAPLPKTLSLPGPTTYTYESIMNMIQNLTYNPPSRAPTVPKPIALLLARAAQLVWWPALSPDEVERRYLNDVKTPGDWDLFGIVPEELENVAIGYVRRYRSAANFAKPVDPHSHKSAGSYHAAE